jgi:hypothetical protein
MIRFNLSGSCSSAAFGRHVDHHGTYGDMMIKSLAHFAIVPADDCYRLKFKMEDDSVIEILASFDQLDLLAEEIDRRLDEDQDLPALPEQ